MVIYNDPEAHGAADAAAGERIFSRADSDTWNHMYAGGSPCRALNSDLKRKKKISIRNAEKIVSPCDVLNKILTN